MPKFLKDLLQSSNTSCFLKCLLRFGYKHLFIGFTLSGVARFPASLHAYVINDSLLLCTCFSKFQDLPVMESMQLALENIVNSIFDGSNEFGGGSSEVQLALCRIFEGFF